ncbi:major facilitator superfamily domain-containing protein [Peziza echinospora]|nr:major facilitator superfamily domain-containing protein [Peziza echinospora]
MVRLVAESKAIWNAYSAMERRNIAIYVVGIMFYKLGLEAFNGSIVTLATDRFKATNAFEKLGVLQGLNQAFQCVGAILIAPLIKRWPTRTVLAVAVSIFGILTAVLLIVDASTGGKIKVPGGKVTYGSWNPNALFPIYCSTGIAYGMVELIRRVIPRDIVGGDVNKLRRMDATVHIFYEVAGTAGAIGTTYLVLRFGNNYSFIVTPIFFTIACCLWLCISPLGFKRQLEDEDKSYLQQVSLGAFHFCQSLYKGGSIICSSRKFFWLPFGYSVALYGHRFLESGLGPIIARRVFDVSAYSQILVGGSNLGELIGAVIVFVLNDMVPTPLPWLRADALLLLITWVIPFYKPRKHSLADAWKLAFIFTPISLGWAAGDVSLAAYIQACLAREEKADPNVSALGAVMAFLYSTYIVIYAISQPLLGRYVDRVWTEKKDVHPALMNIAGVQFTILSAVLLLSTFVPRGAFSLNPKLLFGQDLTGDIEGTNDKMKDIEGEGLEMSDDIAIEKQKKAQIISDSHKDGNLSRPEQTEIRRISFTEDDVAVDLADAVKGRN